MLQVHLLMTGSRRAVMRRRPVSLTAMVKPLLIEPLVIQVSRWNPGLDAGIGQHVLQGMSVCPHTRRSRLRLSCRA